MVKKLRLKKESSAQKENNFTQEELFRAEDVRAVQENLKSSLGTKVKLEDKGGKGKIVIEYFSADERERLIDYLTGKRK